MYIFSMKYGKHLYKFRRLNEWWKRKAKKLFTLPIYLYRLLLASCKPQFPFPQPSNLFRLNHYAFILRGFLTIVNCVFSFIHMYHDYCQWGNSEMRFDVGWGFSLRVAFCKLHFAIREGFVAAKHFFSATS